MKKYILLFVLYIAGFHVLFAQFWNTTEPSGTDEDLYDVYFTGIDKGYVVGGNGLILYTDTGMTWTEQNSGVSGYLHGIVFTDDATGYAVGESGNIVKTTDGGTNWTLLNSGTSKNLLDVFFADENTGYAVGWNSAVIKTTDAGNTWTAAGSGIDSGVILTGVFFTSPDTGYITGRSGYLYKTVNGGESWVPLNINIGSLDLFDLFFTSPEVGYVVGDDSLIFKTTDAGDTWTGSYGGGGQYKGVWFYDENHGFAVGNIASGHSYFAYTGDAGDYWETYSDSFTGGNDGLNSVMIPADTDITLLKSYAAGNDGLILWHEFYGGIMDESADSPVHIYPNPATDQLHLDLSRIEGPVHLDVYTVQGVKIFSGSHLKKNYALDVSSWAPGIYIAEIQYANHTGKYKFCVQ